MNFLESIKMAFTSLMINKMRSFLTMLGIIIGISAVITITTIGNSIKETLNNTFSTLGATTLSLYLNPKNYDLDEYYMTESDEMTLGMINELVNMHPDELYAELGDNFGTAEITNESNETFNAGIAGITDSQFKSPTVRKQIVKGRAITKADLEQYKHSCVVSDVFVEQYFKDPDDAIGSSVTFQMDSGENVHFIIIGVMEYTELQRNQMGINQAKSIMDIETTVYVPYHTMIKLQGVDPDKKIIDWASIGWTSKCDSETAKKYCQEYFDKIYETNPTWTVEVYDPAEELGMINTVLNVITIAISVIAAISLIVGGVGVMNIMLVSILERTREIGVRKALGALNTDVRRQFVIEAIIICLIGGIIGVLCGLINGVLISVIASTLMNSMASEYVDYISLTVQPSIGAIIISLGFSMLTGLIFGYYPAKRAANMNPIDALRYE